MYICDTCPVGTYDDQEAAEHERKFAHRHHMDYVPQDAKILEEA